MLKQLLKLLHLKTESWQLRPLQDFFLQLQHMNNIHRIWFHFVVCSVLILQLEEETAVRERLIASKIITLLGNLKSSESLVYIHFLPPKDQLCKYICSEADTFYSLISCPTTIHERNIFSSCLGPNIHLSKYYKISSFSQLQYRAPEKGKKLSILLYKNSRDKLTAFLCPQIESAWEVQIYLMGLPGLGYGRRRVHESKVGLRKNQF